jgi:glycosyltransferase involved in cell wall biosynthesis
LNIVLINDSASVNGGAAKVALTEARALAESGHSVHLIAAFGPVESKLKEIKNLHVHLLDIRDVNSDPNRLRSMALGMWNPQAYKYTAELLQSFSPGETVIHAHSWTRALSSSVLKAALDSGRPAVITLHDYLMGCPQGTFFRQRGSRICQLKPMGFSCLTTNCDATSYPHKLWRSARKFVQDKAAGVPRNIKHCIYVSNSSLQLLKPYLPGEANCHYLPNPIDAIQGPPASVEQSTVFCFAGRFAPEKGALLFAEAAEAQGVAARFIGDGPQRDQIIRINPSAEMSGWLSSCDTSNALYDARALVFPSLWHEVLGLTVLEAAAQGVPSIVPKGCGAEESVIDGVTGFHFRSGDVRDLGAKIALLKQPTIAATLGKAAYERFWSTAEWSIQTHVQRLELLYTSMLTA